MRPKTPSVPELAPRFDTLAASLVPAPPSKRSVQSFGEARRPLLAGESVKVFVPSINRRRMTSVPGTTLFHPAMTEPSTCAKETVSWAGAGWCPRRARASLHPLVAGVAPLTAKVIGRSPLTRMEAPWRTFSGLACQRNPKIVAYVPPCQRRPARPPSFLRRRAEHSAERKFRPTERTR